MISFVDAVGGVDVAAVEDSVASPESVELSLAMSAALAVVAEGVFREATTRLCGRRRSATISRIDFGSR
jgi:hypothetical protein